MSTLIHSLTADPPWQFRDKLPGPKRGADSHYGTMTTADLSGFLSSHQPKIEPAKDGLLFMWRVSSMVREAIDLCRDWGYVPKSELVWVKTTKTGKRHFGMGHYTRLGHEVCIIASRGKGASLIKSRSVPSVFHAPVGRHSEKPDAFYEIVERLIDGPHVELFARRKREGWVTYGNEIVEDEAAE